jgi:hypothetical protein
MGHSVSSSIAAPGELADALGRHLRGNGPDPDEKSKPPRIVLERTSRGRSEQVPCEFGRCVLASLGFAEEREARVHALSTLGRRYQKGGEGAQRSVSQGVERERAARHDKEAPAATPSRSTHPARALSRATRSSRFSLQRRTACCFRAR